MMRDYIFLEWTPEQNCWWLVKDFYRKEKNIELPDYYIGIPSDKLKHAIFRKNLKADWQPANPNSQPETMLVVMGRGKVMSHVGIWLPTVKKILHLSEASNCRIESLMSLSKIFSTFEFYQYASSTD